VLASLQSTKATLAAGDTVTDPECVALEEPPFNGRRAETRAVMKVNVNGSEHIIDADPTMPLLWAVRDLLGLKGTKFGCGAALCGACTVHVDDKPVRSCSFPLSELGSAKVTTIEAVSGKTADAVRSAWIANNVPQCGYCQSGQIMSAIALLDTNTRPSRADVDAAMSGNLCRCGTYIRIRAAISDAARALA
jgi:isoquinoline 1-oxidoreductase alpha subunit